MYKAFFKNLAEKENGKFFFLDENIAFGNGVRSPNVTYRVEFDYEDNHFTIINRTGTAYVATISCELSKASQPIEFEINNISHFTNLFLRKKSRLKIKADNQNIEYFLTKNLNFKRLVEIAERDKFSPVINCEKNSEWKIVAEYHLEFDNWIEPIEPIVAMYKDLITEFHKRIANISAKAYREMN
jgi:hypothetical protein